MRSGRYIALDWGTTNRRAYLATEEGRILEAVRDDRGVRAVTPGGFPAEIAALRRRFGDLPIIAAGMVGSTKGWEVVPYVLAPATLQKLASSVAHIAGERTAIVPGVAIDDGRSCDVMRGEEVQVLGGVLAGLVPPDALVCQPGTHNKWIWLEEGRIIDFSTAITGEMFALLRAHSTLQDMLCGEICDGFAFRDGVTHAAENRDLLSALFAIRASVLLGRRPTADAAAYCSGLLIGSDIAARGVSAAAVVYLLADFALGDLFTTAIEMFGGSVERVDSHAAFAAGIHHIWKLSA